MSTNQQEENDCIARICKIAPGLFECQVFKCKTRFPEKTERHFNSIIRCIRNKCKAKLEKSLCKNIKECDGKVESKTCIAKLFENDRFEKITVKKKENKE